MDDDDTADPTVSMTAADTTLLEVLDHFRGAGWRANHQAVADGRIRCGNCNAISPADSVRIAAKHRLEGASDPQDEMYVFGFNCPACGTGGVIVAGYGPTSSERDQQLIVALGDDHDAVDPVATESPAPRRGKNE